MEILFYTLVAVGFLYLLHVSLFTIGGNLYDSLHFRKQRRLPQRVKRYRPSMTILVPAYNETVVIERCLKSIIDNRYPKLQIIVIDDASDDGTPQLVRQFMARHPKQNIRLVARRRNAGKASGLTYALKRYATGELVMVLDGDAALAKDALRKAAMQFAAHDLSGLAANVRIIGDTTILNLLQLFEYLVSYRTKKLYSVSGSELIIGGVGSVYKRKVIEKFGYYSDTSWTEDIGLSMKVAAHGSKRYRLSYAMDVVAYTESVETLRGLFRQRYRWKLGSLQNLARYTKQYYRTRKEQNAFMVWYRIPMAYLSEALLLFEPFLLLFALYLSVVSGTAILFLSAYVLLVSYTYVVLWSDEHFTAKQKAGLSLYVPTIYFLFYVMSLIQISALLRCLFNFKSISAHAGGAWVSPERHGHQLAGSEA